MKLCADLRPISASALLVIWATTSSVVNSQECVPREQRIDCHPDREPVPTEARCLARGCLWCPLPGESDTPSCITKPDHGYLMESLVPLPDDGGYQLLLKRASIDNSYFGSDFDLLTATIEFQSDYRLRIRISPDMSEGEQPRFEVPLKINPPAAPPTVDALYAVEFENDPAFALKVVRRSTGTVLFDTSLGGFTFSDQFIQLAIRLPSTNVYGIGENEQHALKHDFTNFTSFPLWARGAPPNGNTNIYGVQPYYTVVEPEGNTHSVMILNSNAQEFVAHPAPGFVYRTIGGILDIYIFLGPTPEDTTRQFTEAIGRAPIPPYWGLGFQLCRWGYGTLGAMQGAVNRTLAAGIPFDVQYGDIDIMERALDFTYDRINFAGLPEYILELKAQGIKFITILDPGISFNEPPGTYETFDLGTEMDVWLKKPDGEPTIGEVWPGLVYYPDYSKNSTREWWIYLINKFYDLLAYDGLWIDMNEPVSRRNGDAEQGCANTTAVNSPPYVPPILDGILSNQTLCPDVQSEIGLHYDTHSLYGWSESEPTQAGVRAALGKRSIVLTRSSFLGVGRWASHWLGDNYSRWSNLHYSIIGVLQFNQFGVPYVGADICGFFEEASSELCLRWHQLGAFYPFCRNHNGIDNPEQDPGSYGPVFEAAVKRVMEIRYTLLPYLYTLFYEHARYGGTVARPLWHSFPHDPVALPVDRQFMWGDGLLISPVLGPGAITVSAYFPGGAGAARWYSFYDGREVTGLGDGSYVTLAAPFDFINLHVLGGRIIPTQEPAANTELSRLNPYGLIVAFDARREAAGGLYLDDGDSIDPEISGAYTEITYCLDELSPGWYRLRNTVLHDGYDVSGKVLDTIRIMGNRGPIGSVLVNGGPHNNFTYNPDTKEAGIYALGLPLGTQMSVSWVDA